MKSLYKVWKTINKDRKSKENCINKFNEGGKSFANIKCAFNANILINNSGVLYNTAINSEYFFIPIENIKKVEVKTDEELSKQITDSKIPIIGDLNFARKIHFFLIIKYTENNMEIEKTVEAKMADVVVTAILKARQHYIKKFPMSFLEELDYTLEPIPYNEKSKDIDIPDQINKLFDLLEKGAISSEEFKQKKEELLSRM